MNTFWLIFAVFVVIMWFAAFYIGYEYGKAQGRKERE